MYHASHVGDGGKQKAHAEQDHCPKAQEQNGTTLSACETLLKKMNVEDTIPSKRLSVCSRLVPLSAT